MKATTANRGPGAVMFGAAATLLVAGGGLLGGYFVAADAGKVPAAEAAKARPSDAPTPSAELVTEVARGLTREAVTLAIGPHQAELTWQDLGLGVDREALDLAVRAARHTEPNPAAVRAALSADGSLPVVLDRERASEALAAFKRQHDAGPRAARMDLEARTIHPAAPGRSLDIYASLGTLQAAAQSGAAKVALDTVAVAPEVTVEDLGIDDISTVLASFETRYAPNDRIRNFNLELAASKINGHVLQPGQEFSFNEVVGARTEQEGYKIAGVISAGEMVDGLAGGTCQVSTTLHGAAFFAGLDIVKALPHSRPSTYVTMGLDATVVYPQVDVKLANPYDFPVAIHFKINSGTARVEILGRERPYDKIVYEREVKEQLDFDTITREDDTIPIGTLSIDQYGFYGYEVEKVRKFYKDGELKKRDKWNIRYRPVTEYVRNGVNPDPNLVPPKQKKKRKKRLREAEVGEVYKLAQ